MLILYILRIINILVTYDMLFLHEIMIKLNSKMNQERVELEQSTPSVIFALSLSNDQKTFLNSILPKKYSFQPLFNDHRSNLSPIGNRNTKAMGNRRFNIQIKEQMHQQDKNHISQSLDNKQRRKLKSYQHIQSNTTLQVANNQQQLSNFRQTRKNANDIGAMTYSNSLHKMINIVKKLKKSEYSWPFRSLVDSKPTQIHRYNQNIMVQVDFFTIQERIKTDKYDHYSQIERDILQMMMNSYKLYSKDSQFYEATTKLQQEYQSLLRQSQQGVSLRRDGHQKNKKEANRNSSSAVNDHQQKQKSAQVQILQFQKDLLNLIKKTNEVSNNVKKVRQKPIYVSFKNDGPMNVKQKKQLVQQIKGMEQGHLGRILDIIRNRDQHFHNTQLHTTNGQTHNKNGHIVDQIINIDFDKLDIKVLKQLQNYVRLQKNSINYDKEQSYADSQDNAQYSIQQK